MITPPSSPSENRGNSSPIYLGSPGRILFGGSPKRGPPDAPSKKRTKPKIGDDKKPSYALKGLVILDVPCTRICNLGVGSFGVVDKVLLESSLGTPCSPQVAMKKIVDSPKQGPKGLLKEAANLGKPGCAFGVAATDIQGNLFLFTSLAIPLTQIYYLGRQILDQIIVMTKSAIMQAPLSVVYDCKPANLGLVQKGTPTVVADPNGQPCVGPLTDVDSVVFLDLGTCGSPEEADGNFNPLLDDDALETEDEQLKFRKFKCEMMEALLWNQFAEHPQEENLIVAIECTKRGWSYARGL